MDDFLLIILTFIFVLWGLLKQQKPQSKNVPDPADSEVEDPTDLWELLLDQETKEAQQEETVIDMIPEEEGEPAVVRAEETERERPKCQTDISGINESEITHAVVAPKRRWKYAQDFSLKKAMVYSVILHRKYF